MAWIESHQELGAHPKTRKMASILGIHRMQVVGHVHALWWWALDYADDGDLAHFTDDDIAIGADWDGDPSEFVAALKECGPGERAGFLTADGLLNDWHEYAGKLVDRRKKDRERKAQSRTSPETVPRTSDGQDRDGRVDGVRTQPNRTQPKTSLRSVEDPPTEVIGVWTAMEDLFGEVKTKTERARRGKLVKSLIDAGAEFSDVKARAEAWPKLFPAKTGETIRLTDHALEKHWAALGKVLESVGPEWTPESCAHPAAADVEGDGSLWCPACERAVS